MMNKSRFLFTAIFFFTLGAKAYCQGLNNNYPVDSTDIKNCLNLLGFEIFKFPVQAEKNCSINFIVDEYRNGELITTDDYLDGLKDFPEKYWDLMTPKANTSLNWFRIYCYDQNDSTLLFQLNYAMMESYLPFETSPTQQYGYRAFDFDGLKMGEKKVLIIRYAKETTGSGIIHCPAGLSLTEVIENYSHVIAISVELIEEEQKVSD